MYEDGDISLRGLDPDKAQAKVETTFNEHAHKLREMEAQGRTSAEKLQAIDSMIVDLRVAQEAQREVMQQAAERRMQGPEVELRGFIEGDRVRLVGAETDDGGADVLYQPGLLDSRRTFGDWHAELRELVTKRSLAKLMRRSGATPKFDRALASHIERGPAEIRKRIFGATGTGAEWIPTQMLVPDLDMAVALMAEGTVAAQFRTVPMSTKVITVPYASTGGTPYVQGEPVSDPAKYTAVLPSTAARTHTAKTFALRYQLDNDSAEDAVNDTYGDLRLMIAADMVDGYEDAFINGDTATPHQDTGIAAWNPASRWGASSFGGDADHRKAILGLRARAADISNTLDMGSLQTFDGLMQLRGRLQARSRSAIILVNEKFLYTKMFAFDELQKTDSSVGQVSDGRITTIAGMPVFTSLFMTSDLNASGVYDDSTKTKAGLLVVDASRFAHYERRGTLIELQRDATRGVTDMVATLRRTFKTNEPTSSGLNVAYGYNLL